MLEIRLSIQNLRAILQGSQFNLSKTKTAFLFAPGQRKQQFYAFENVI